MNRLLGAPAAGVVLLTTPSHREDVIGLAAHLDRQSKAIVGLLHPDDGTAENLERYLIGEEPIGILCDNALVVSHNDSTSFMLGAHPRSITQVERLHCFADTPWFDLCSDVCLQETTTLAVLASTAELERKLSRPWIGTEPATNTALGQLVRLLVARYETRRSITILRIFPANDILSPTGPTLHHHIWGIAKELKMPKGFLGWLGKCQWRTLAADDAGGTISMCVSGASELPLSEENPIYAYSHSENPAEASLPFTSQASVRLAKGISPALGAHLIFSALPSVVAWSWLCDGGRPKELLLAAALAGDYRALAERTWFREIVPALAHLTPDHRLIERRQWPRFNSSPFPLSSWSALSEIYESCTAVFDFCIAHDIAAYCIGTAKRPDFTRLRRARYSRPKRKKKPTNG